MSLLFVFHHNITNTKIHEWMTETSTASHENNNDAFVMAQWEGDKDGKIVMAKHCIHEKITEKVFVIPCFTIATTLNS